MELEYIQLTFGIAAAVFGFVMKTQNVRSTFIFKLVPFFGGQATIFISLIQLGFFVT